LFDSKVGIKYSSASFRLNLTFYKEKNMLEVTPKVFVIAESKINQAGLQDYLSELGVPEWKTDTDVDAQILTEVAGKSCYKSFSTDLNKNLTRANARDNHTYIQEGIIGTKHGSVLEHSSVTFALVDVSRVLTHELVRHRPGTGFSQESGRYVRTDEIRMYIPPEIKENDILCKAFIEKVVEIERFYKELEEISGVNTMTNFAQKKRMTSALRRILPEGRANTIIFTSNHRSLRHLIQVRTSEHAEVEIREAFVQLYSIINQAFPAMYADAKIVPSSDKNDDIPQIIFENEKI
jgi:thymidylate synthase (FAD)